MTLNAPTTLLRHLALCVGLVLMAQTPIPADAQTATPRPGTVPGLPGGLGTPPQPQLPQIGRGTIYSKPVEIELHESLRGCMIESCREWHRGEHSRRECRSTFWTFREMEARGVPRSRCQ